LAKQDNLQAGNLLLLQPHEFQSHNRVWSSQRQLKMSFTHGHVAPNHYDFLSPVENKKSC